MRILELGGERADASAVTVGKFDGVHLGHQALLETVRTEAAGRGVPAGVLTFDRHPAEVLRPGAAPPYLTPLPEKLRLLEQAGMDFCLLLRVESDVLSWPGERFVREALAGQVGSRSVVVGPDFQYGRDRRGTPETLRAEGAAIGFEVTVVPPVLVGGRRVSSFAIREALAAGDLEAARRMLGRRYSVVGTVSEGRRLGRQLGYPTANIAFDGPVALPSFGIYAVHIRWGDQRRSGTASLGVRPTVEAGPAPVKLEVFVHDWSGDLYGEQVRVKFVARLRDEERFESLEALTAQIARDVERSRRVLAELS